MNFLQLVQRTRSECGVSGSQPISVANQVAEIARLVAWVNTAWVDIQSERQDWDFLRSPVTFQTVLAKPTYTPIECGITDFGMWARDSFRNYETAAGTNSEVFMEYIDYELWRNTYQFSTLRASYSRPLQITITPNKSLGLGQVPLAGYTVVGEYFRQPTELVLDTDIPSIPTQFHMAIVYKAMMHYGAYEAASEVYQRGEVEYKKIMKRLLSSQMPEIVFCGALS